jgi:hypothetical protein
MSEIYLTSVAGKKVPANGENDKHIGKDKGTQDIRVLRDSRDNEQKQKKD